MMWIAIFFFIAWQTVFGEGATPGAAVAEMNRKAVALLREGEMEQAVTAAKQAVALAERELGTDHPRFSAALANLGEIYVEMGRFGEAEPPMRRALEVAETSWGMDPESPGKILNNLGKLYAKQGRFDEAEALYLRALEQEQTFAEPRPSAATWRNNLGALYMAQGRYKDAWPLYERSITLLADRRPDPAIAESFSAMGALFSREGKLDDAETALTWSLDLRRKLFGDAHLETASALHNMGQLKAKRGNLEEAERLMREAYAIRSGSLPSDHPELLSSQFDLAILLDRRGRTKLARHFFDEAAANLQSRFRRAFTYMSEQDRLDYLDTLDHVFPTYFSFCVRHASGDPTLIEAMYDLLLFQKGMILSDIRSLRASLRDAGDSESLTLLDRLTRGQALLANLEQRAFSSPDSEPNLAKQIEDIGRRNAEWERQLVRRSADFARNRDQPTIRWRQVRDALDSDQTAVEYLLFRFFDGRDWDGERYVALVLRAADSHPRLVMLGTAQNLHGTPITDYRQRAGLERDPTLPNTPGFYEAFIEPIEPLIGKRPRLDIAPGGILSQVAWSTISRPDGRLLIEGYDLRLISSTRDLVDSPTSTPTHTALVVGDPDYGGGDDDTLKPFPPLPGTRAEIRALAELLSDQRWSVRTLEGRQANELDVTGVRQPTVLHLATHGFFRDMQKDAAPRRRSDPMLRSGLALAGANAAGTGREPGERDGILTALEVSTMDLRGTELVVLSACETAIGDQTLGEGVFGLRRGFRQAGANAILMSLWKVPDRATKDLMVRYYRNWLGGKNKHRALQDAQLALRDEIRTRWGRDRPQMWGGFILVGR